MDLTTGKIRNQLFTFTMPILAMNLINQAYGLADSLIVARFAGETQLGIISSANAVTAVGYCLVNGASAAVTILTARASGKKDDHAFCMVYRTCMNACLLFSVLIGLVYFAFAEGMLSLIDLPQDLLKPTASVVYIYALSMMIQMINGVVNAVLQGSGDSKSPMYICLSAQCFNIALDYIAVALLHTGAKGAA